MSNKLPSEEQKWFNRKAEILWSQLSEKGRKLLKKFVEGTFTLNQFIGRLNPEDIEEVRWFCNIDNFQLKRHQDRLVKWTLEKWIPEKRKECRQRLEENEGRDSYNLIHKRLEKLDRIERTLLEG